MATNTFPTIKTERLLLRKLEETDANVILFLRSDEGINTYIQRPVQRQTKSIEDAIKHINKVNKGFENSESISWGIALDEDTPLIGTICLWNYTNNNSKSIYDHHLSGHPNR